MKKYYTKMDIERDPKYAAYDILQELPATKKGKFPVFVLRTKEPSDMPYRVVCLDTDRAFKRYLTVQMYIGNRGWNDKFDRSIRRTKERYSWR